MESVGLRARAPGCSCSISVDEGAQPRRIRCLLRQVVRLIATHWLRPPIMPSSHYDYDSNHSTTGEGSSRRRVTDLAEVRKNSGVRGMVAGNTAPDSTPKETEYTIEGRVNVLPLGDHQLPITVPPTKPKQRPKPTTPEDEDYEDIDENFMEELRKTWVRVGSPSPRRFRSTLGRSDCAPVSCGSTANCPKLGCGDPGAKSPWRMFGPKKLLRQLHRALQRFHCREAEV
ncbi:hypothetical protein BJ742DRAFT_472336 [Cladochytrium replicatum]|nr:hypothetical protein BJ742DRAFT_472336 [Cladochytrium replicatum]